MNAGYFGNDAFKKQMGSCLEFREIENANKPW
jgi:hypothetical protein